MKNIYVTLMLCTSLYSQTAMYSVSPEKALDVVSLANEHIFVCVSLDIPTIKQLYTYNYDEMLKHLQKQHTSQSRRVVAFITRIMKIIDPLYPMLYHTAPHVVGITRRSLGWSHLIRSSCYQHDIVQLATRYVIPIKIDEQAPPLESISTDSDEVDLTGYDYAECNTGVLYIGTLDVAQVITEYIRQHPIACYGIIYVDTDYDQVNACTERLKTAHPTLEIIGLHVDSSDIQSNLEHFQDVDAYMQSATESIATQSSVFSRHPELFSGYDIPAEHLSKNMRGQKR